MPLKKHENILFCNTHYNNNNKWEKGNGYDEIQISLMDSTRFHSAYESELQVPIHNSS
jgi:hypothetical protein